MGRAAVRIALSALMLVVASTTASASPARLDDVKVATDADAMVVELRTSRVPRYTTELLDSPHRLVVDLEDTTYGWRTTPLSVGAGPIKAVRGAQTRKDRARIVIDLTRRVGFVVNEDSGGVSITIPTTAADATPAVPVVPVARPATPVARPVAIVAAAETTASDTARPADSERPITVAQAKPAPTQAPSTPVTPPPPPAAATTPMIRSSNGHRLISLDFKDADVVNLLRILAAESGRNIVIGEDVKGKISISLHNVPWEQALATILESRGLVKVEKENVIRFVSVDQLAKEREAAARVEEAKLKADADVRTKLAEAAVKEAEAASKKLAAEAAQREQDARGPLREETVRLSYADPEEVENTLKGILGIPKDGTRVITGVPVVMPSGPPPNPELPAYIQPGPQPVAPVPQAPTSVSQDVLNKGLTIRAHKPTNTIFLRLYARDLETVKRLIREALDIPLPQVKIEARMEILDRSALEQIGVQWGGGFAQNAGSQTLVGQGYQTTTNLGQTVPLIPGLVTPDNKTLLDPIAITGLTRQVSPLSSGFQPAGVGGLSGLLPVSSLTGLPMGGNVVNLPLSALPNAGPLPAGGVVFGLIGARYNINLALQALNERGKTRTLARPEIVTVENAKAAMSLGEEIPFATISSAGTQIQFKEALLKLEVTPTVIREGDVNRIKMLVVVENNDRGATVNLGNAGNPPAINRRKAETQVLIREGDRLVIGGVTTNTSSNTVRKIPVLGDIPVLGWLFKQKEDFEKGRELVVFLTPSILRSTGLAQAPAATR